MILQIEESSIFVLCFASALCQRVAVTSLGENMVESRQELILEGFYYFFLYLHDSIL